MGERPDEIGRDPLDRREPLGRDPHPLAGEPGFDPATDAFRPDAVDPDPGRLRDDEVEVTRVEIERTRADMSETANAIQRRLSPENLKEQAKDRVREATVGRIEEAGSGITETIRQNPVPAALTGIGLGWLLMSARRKRRSGRASTIGRTTTTTIPPRTMRPTITRPATTSGNRAVPPRAGRPWNRPGTGQGKPPVRPGTR